MELHPPERVAEYEALGVWGVPVWPERVSGHVARASDRTAVVDAPNLHQLMGLPPQRLTWAGVQERARDLAAVLLASGVAPGDVVGLQLPNCADLAVSYVALSTIGAVATPFPMQYREYELTQMLELAGAKAFVGTAEFQGTPLGERLAALAAVGSVATVLTFGPRAVDGHVDLTAALAGPVDRGPLDRLVVDLDPNDAVTICWTSGTEATPKGVPRCANDWEPMGLTSVDAMGLTADDVILNPFPLVNMAGIGGMLVPWLLTGATLVLHHPFDAPVFFDQIRTEQVTYTVVPPALLVRALDLPFMTPEGMSSLRHIGSGSAPLPPAMIRAYKERLGIDIVNCFGSNEGLNLVGDPATVPDPELRSRLFARFGSPDHAWSNRGPRGYRTKLIDPSSGAEITEEGVPGELLVRGPGVIAGYLAGTTTSDPFTEDGFYRSGDLFMYVADADGDLRYLQYVDRAKDMIVRGGMNISPAELEELVGAHEDVAEVAVVGVPDPQLGERTRAVVVPREGATVTLESLVDFLRERHIASYKLPESLLVVDELPRNPVGKVLKRSLRRADAT
ncbi:class I adenylate-forming enzyme family protein [Aeromicrobium choanae]|uniref:Acyl-CoA synthetase (AMP-forming)/AMP-acid ligase II n=1 Tax=Aeromicrobium choanae TaxID=1736691 RepID=A0A1T4YTZ6_9ACTN|nr:class I adenylate-forming enzyme family protein [Aeromicrobium choanae]SKB05304.1 Acyl-CoA synthetase (AMP-forming)/AMP-acid ligase II [Aeromicrobium choanae]